MKPTRFVLPVQCMFWLEAVISLSETLSSRSRQVTLLRHLHWRISLDNFPELAMGEREGGRSKSPKNIWIYISIDSSESFLCITCILYTTTWSWISIQYLLTTCSNEFQYDSASSLHLPASSRRWWFAACDTFALFQSLSLGSRVGIANTLALYNTPSNANIKH